MDSVPEIPKALPTRQFSPKIRVRATDEFGGERGRGMCRIPIHCSQLSDDQAALLTRVLTELPTAMAKIRQQRRAEASALITRTFTQSTEVVEQYRAEAWQHENWRRSVLHDLPCLLTEEAKNRCDGTPWSASEHLLWVAHRGRRWFPLCQFTEAGPPDPAWVAVVAHAKEIGNCYEWELLLWLMTPHPMLSGDQTPLEALSNDPKRVISLAGYTLKESRS